VEALAQRLARATQAALRTRGNALKSEQKRLEALSPQAVLDRGYAHVTRSGDGSTVRRSGDVAVGEGLRVRVSQGGFDAVVAGQAQLDLGGGEG
jgi:exodeoxyribonuclease VII large subunit